MSFNFLKKMVINYHNLIKFLLNLIF